jgi:hypothetical protein
MNPYPPWKCRARSLVARGGPDLAQEHADRGAFAGAIVAQQAKHVAPPHFQRQVRHRRPVAKPLGKIPENNHGAGSRMKNCFTAPSA